MVSVGGLASGLDTQGIISQLLELERRPIAQLEQQVQELTASQGRYTGLTPAVEGVRAAARALSDAESLQQPTVTGGGSGVQVSARQGAALGAYDLVVDQLAQAGRRGSQGFDADEAIASGPGTFAVRAGASGAVISVAVDDTTTLRDVADAINGHSGDVSAAVINDGTAAKASRLVLTSSRTGREFDVDVVTNDTDLVFDATTIEDPVAAVSNAASYTGTVSASGTFTGSESKSFIVEIMSGGPSGVATYRVSSDGGQTFDDNGGAGYTTSAAASALGGGSEGVEIAFSDSGTLTSGDRFTVDVTAPVLQEAKDAVFTLNGIQQTRATNTVSDAVEGLDISLTEADPNQVLRFSVGRNDQGVVDAVKGLVDAYNEVFGTIREQQTFDPSTNTAGPLLGDRTANSILSSLRQTLTAPADNVVSGPRRLLDLGIRSNAETGQLSLDESRLRELLTQDRDGVLGLLASRATGTVDELRVASRPSGAPAGNYQVSITTAPERARITAGGAFTALAADETLTFSFSRNNDADTPTFDNFTVSLTAGSSPEQVVQQLNSRFGTQGVDLVASSESGVVTVESTDFGADFFFSVQSDTAAGGTSSQFGTSLQSDAGVDVAGLIAGGAATGDGALLTSDSGVTEGMVVEYTGTGTGPVGELVLTQGVGELFARAAERISSGSDSVLGVRNQSIQDQIDRLNDQIEKKNEQVARTQERLEREFSNLEVTLAQLQSQSTFLTNQLAQLAPQ
jgi:flagellar hook-associated protein 2